MSKKETVEMEVAVHKAAINLKAGESVHDFTSSLSTAGKEHVFQKLNTTKKEAYAYMVEAFGNYTVFEANIHKSDKGYRYYAFTYKRDKEDNFEFGKLVEVKRKTTFQLVQTEITKNLDGWVETEKSLWEGVV